MSARHTIKTAIGTMEFAVEPPAWFRSQVKAQCAAIRRDTRSDAEVRDQYVVFLAERQGIKAPRDVAVEIFGTEAVLFTRTGARGRKLKRSREIGRVPLPAHLTNPATAA